MIKCGCKQGVGPAVYKTQAFATILDHGGYQLFESRIDRQQFAAPTDHGTGDAKRFQRLGHRAGALDAGANGQQSGAREVRPQLIKLDAIRARKRTGLKSSLHGINRDIAGWHRDARSRAVAETGRS